MTITKEKKEEIIKNLKDKIGKAKSIVFAKFDGFKVKDNEDLRKELKSEASEYYVAKKTLFDLAFKDEKIDGFNVRDFEGRVAAVFGYGDEVTPAKIVDQYRDKLKGQVDFIGGILENKFIDADRVSQLAKLPSKQELYAKIVGSINAPVSGFVNVLAGNLRGLVCVLKAIEEKK
ncbi:MAG: 50S ribosomal protein L10 [Alphaproteobacteria bacterium]